MGSLLEPLAWFYGKFFIGHAWLGYAIICSIGAAVMAILFAMAIDKYEKDNPDVKVAEKLKFGREEQSDRSSATTEVKPKSPKSESHSAPDSKIATTEKQQEEAIKPPETQQQPKPPFLVSKLTFTQESVPSKRDDAPYAVKVVIQTNVVRQPTSVAIKCDAEFVSGEFHVAGVGSRRDTGDGYVGDKTVYWLFFGDPPFRPETPIIVTLMSKTAIHILAVGDGPPR